jgi:hypothetical protein
MTSALVESERHAASSITPNLSANSAQEVDGDNNLPSEDTVSSKNGAKFMHTIVESKSLLSLQSQSLSSSSSSSQLQSISLSSKSSSNLLVAGLSSNPSRKSFARASSKSSLTTPPALVRNDRSWDGLYGSQPSATQTDFVFSQPTQFPTRFVPPPSSQYPPHDNGAANEE